MTPERSNKISEKIEAVCGQGCTEVNQLLKQAESGNTIEILSEFSDNEISLIINELNEIMSVYDVDKDGCKNK